jgi:hypothetical protein
MHGRTFFLPSVLPSLSICRPTRLLADQPTCLNWRILTRPPGYLPTCLAWHVACNVNNQMAANGLGGRQMDTREMRIEMVRMLSATAALATGVSLAFGGVIVAVIAILQ